MMPEREKNPRDFKDEGCYPPKKDPKDNKCPKPPKWICRKEPSWRLYIKKCADDARKRAAAEREEYGEFYHLNMKEKDHSKMPKEGIASAPYCRMLNAFNQKARRCIDLKRPTSQIWHDMRTCRKYDDCPPTPSPFDWPNVAPCLPRDVVKDRKVLARKLKMKQLGATPCQIEEIILPESSDDEKLEELASKKELVHAKIPITYITEYPPVMIDRSCGERIALVDGDCIVYELSAESVDRTYANLCLRGMKGMHIEELQRFRLKTWKFCLFQNIVALLVKTQFRYKYVWSANIDYIYDQGWKMFAHTGFLNAKSNQRFDDILVYNYMYNVELQLVHEIKDIPIIRDVTFEYFEKSLKDQKVIQRNKETVPKCQFGQEKHKDNWQLSVHKCTKRIEKWFNKLDEHYTNCILRTSRFSVAFWQDGLFWFLYNPYRCDKFGFWDDCGYAAIIKFCTKDALRRHLMILILRAYAYKLDELDMCLREYNYFTIQIYQMVYHSCKIHNVKLYLRGPKKPKPELVEKTISAPCLYDPYTELSSKPCEENKPIVDTMAQELNAKVEQPRWLQEMKICWSRANRSECKKPKWHEYEILEPRRLFVLWCDIHITDVMFAQENRNKQARACYVVCAGMCKLNTPEYWDSDNLKAILVYGDMLFSKRHLHCSVNEKPRVSSIDDDADWHQRPTDKFQICDTYFDVEVLIPVRGHLYTPKDQCLWRTVELFFQQHKFGILTCENARLGIFKQNGAYYVLDAYSSGPPVFKSGDGKAYLLRMSCLRDFVSSLVLIIGSVECSPFWIRPVEIGNMVEVADKCAKKPPEKEPVDCSYGAIQPKPGCVSAKEKKKQCKPPTEVGKEKTKKICVPQEEFWNFDDSPCKET